jgi:hypothetical protein
MFAGECCPFAAPDTREKQALISKFLTSSGVDLPSRMT